MTLERGEKKKKVCLVLQRHEIFKNYSSERVNATAEDVKQALRFRDDSKPTPKPED